jgi:hypothetical protein
MLAQAASNIAAAPSAPKRHAFLHPDFVTVAITG